MTSQTALMYEQEVRRQAMLHAMQVDVWLPRQQLVNAADSLDYLLEWETAETVAVAPVVSAVQPARVASPVAEAQVSVARPRGTEHVSVRDKLAALGLETLQAPADKASTAAAVMPAAEAESVPEAAKVQAEPIPRFALQLLRADNCLVLVDLPTGEPFQSRDPDYQLLRDMLRAAGLTDKPSVMRQGAPITWPMLLSGSLMHEQNATQARACVRDLLSVELYADPAVCVWLVGSQAVRFASADDQTQLYSMQPFAEGAQLWSLPSLEKVLEQPLIKREIWQSMCAQRSLWQVQDD